MIGIIGAMDEEVKKLREMIQNGKVVKKQEWNFFVEHWEKGRLSLCTLALARSMQLYVHRF